MFSMVRTKGTTSKETSLGPPPQPAATVKTPPLTLSVPLAPACHVKRRQLLTECGPRSLSRDVTMGQKGSTTLIAD